MSARAELPSARPGRWELPDGTAFELEVRVGKPLDVLGLKRTSLTELRDYAEGLARTAAELYAPEASRREIESCPMCAHPTDHAPVAAEVYGVSYHRCPRCGHGFVRSQPVTERIEARYAESDELAATYTDPESLELRMEQVVEPKVAWTLEAFRRHRGGDPRSAIDVGAGGGHFVAGLERAGIHAEGYEVSAASRRFARDAFGLDLRNEDFLAADAGADLVTFWGLLEYTPEPRRFLEAARRTIADEPGMLVVEVPRLDCLSSAVQQELPETVARHLDPTSHLNCFSDAGLATALHETGFRPVAAWYFGMDAYELAVQLALRVGDESFARLADLLLPLQGALDEALFCDDLVVAALPQA
jgi:2-polyprenyl-3-methyl-5-hydroxy-6-metoxy-1,4-benzoquinol methylase